MIEWVYFGAGVNRFPYVMSGLKQDVRDLKVMKKCTDEARIDISQLDTKELDEFEEKLEDRE